MLVVRQAEPKFRTLWCGRESRAEKIEPCVTSAEGSTCLTHRPRPATQDSIFSARAAEGFDVFLPVYNAAPPVTAKTQLGFTSSLLNIESFPALEIERGSRFTTPLRNLIGFELFDTTSLPCDTGFDLFGSRRAKGSRKNTWSWSRRHKVHFFVPKIQRFTPESPFIPFYLRAP